MSIAELINSFNSMNIRGDQLEPGDALVVVKFINDFTEFLENRYKSVETTILHSDIIHLELKIKKDKLPHLFMFVIRMPIHDYAEEVYGSDITIDEIYKIQKSFVAAFKDPSRVEVPQELVNQLAKIKVLGG